MFRWNRPSRQLADLGARVIKIERPGAGDFARSYDAMVHGLSSHFVWLNRNKESFTLDVKAPRQRQVLDELLEHVRRQVRDGEFVGQSTSDTSGGGFGLVGLTERVGDAGGTLTAGPADGGWRVRAVLPLTPTLP